MHGLEAFFIGGGLQRLMGIIIADLMILSLVALWAALTIWTIKLCIREVKK